MPSRAAKMFNFRLDPQDTALMKAVARREGLTPSAFARVCIMRRVKRLALQHAAQDAMRQDGPNSTPARHSVLSRPTQR
jgi:hypothetical protein